MTRRANSGGTVARPNTNPKPRTRRADNDGTVSSYTTSSGEERWRIAYYAELPNGERVRRFKRGFLDAVAARTALREILVDVDRGEHVEDTGETLNSYRERYFAALRVRDTTLAGYRKHYRVHVEPANISSMPLVDLTKDHLNSFYRQLERNGRKDRGHVGEPLGPATVRHVHVLISQILEAALDDGLVRTNPAKRASPPSVQDAAPPEMTTWSPDEAKTFLEWSRDKGDYLHMAWFVLLSTGMRRGELLALRWRDIDFDNHVVTVARSLSYVKEAGKKPVVTFTRPKNGKVRNVDVDAAVTDALRERRSGITSVAPEFARAASLVFTNRFGQHHNPVQFSRQWRERVAQAIEAHPDLPRLHLHELRHTHATMLLRAGVHPKIVSERLGHSDVQITLNTYSHAVQTMQRDAANLVGSMLS